MIRDITMIISVLVSVVSVGFGLYKNIEAGNARGYAYEQAYRVLNVVQQANISTAAKAAITNDALETFGTPPPVIDLSRSRADVGESEPCTDDVRVSCASLADRLAEANALCKKEKTVSCAAADDMKASILQQKCYTCF
ncbi:MAG TPA: hypothetical protein VJ553_01200 [Candidatus Paceibacterota bacterium]|nr:hypothetical protein [Candidatus Paceibacterota bacterium]